jgi:hypothetical protein
MSKRTLAMKKSVRPQVASPAMFEGLETRQMMSVGPASIPNATTNDAVFDAGTKTLHAIYNDTGSKSLKYQGFNDDGTTAGPVNVDSGVNTGLYLSLTEDSSGVLHAAYYDAQNGDLKYARRATDGVWTTTTIDSKNTTGYYPSITIAADGRPAISYYYKNGGNLRLAKFNGSTWDISTIASDGDVGRYSALQMNPGTKKLSVACEETSTGHYVFGEQGAGGVWNMATVDGATRGGGGYISLNFSDANLPAISYYDAVNADLKYAERSSRGKWNATTVAAKNSQGLYTDLAFTYNTDQPAIVYYNKTSDSVMLAYRQPGGSWSFEATVTGGGRNVTPVDGLVTGNQAPDLYLIYSNSTTGGLTVGTF